MFSELLNECEQSYKKHKSEKIAVLQLIFEIETLVKAWLVVDTVH